VPQAQETPSLPGVGAGPADAGIPGEQTLGRGCRLLTRRSSQFLLPLSAFS
jgi:hypothetical protein